MRRFITTADFAAHPRDRQPVRVKADVEVVIDDKKLIEMARKAYLNKGGQSKDGPVTVTIKTHTEVPIQ